MSARTNTVLIPVIDGEVDEMLPPPVGVATYTVRRFPAPWLGLKVGGTIACLFPLAYALSQILGGAA